MGELLDGQELGGRGEGRPAEAEPAEQALDPWHDDREETGERQGRQQRRIIAEKMAALRDGRG